MGQLRMFERYVGIDYSGAGTPKKRNRALQVFVAIGDCEPTKNKADTNWNWNRKEIAHWCLEQLKKQGPIIIGIDHAFSFPISYINRYVISNWNDFLDDFYTHWPTDIDNITVESLRRDNQRTGNFDEFRLTPIFAVRVPYNS
jgi:hypothetical protein